jgi:hypothetical protein
MNTTLPINREKANEIVSHIAERVLNGWDESLSLCIDNLDEESLIRLHYMIVQGINEMYQPDLFGNILTSSQSEDLYQYTKALPRTHCGLFWKILNYYHRQLSEIWYLGNELVCNLILNSLLCFANSGTMAHKAQSFNLDIVMGYQMMEAA